MRGYCKRKSFFWISERSPTRLMSTALDCSSNLLYMTDGVLEDVRNSYRVSQISRLPKKDPKRVWWHGYTPFWIMQPRPFFKALNKVRISPLLAPSPFPSVLRGTSAPSPFPTTAATVPRVQPGTTVGQGGTDSTRSLPDHSGCSLPALEQEQGGRTSLPLPLSSPELNFLFSCSSWPQLKWGRSSWNKKGKWVQRHM